MLKKTEKNHFSILMKSSFLVVKLFLDGQLYVILKIVCFCGHDSRG